MASDDAFEVSCPDCGAMLKVDPVTRTIIAHTSAPRKKMFEDFGEAARALRESDERRDSTQRALRAEEAERLRIARELHDDVGQSLTVLLLELARARREGSATKWSWIGSLLSGL